MREAGLWRAIKQNLPMVHWQRIESGSTSQGIPDLNGCYQGHEVWLELKAKRGVLSKWQINWARQRRDAGGRVFMVKDLGDIVQFAHWAMVPKTLDDYWFRKPIPWDQILKLLFEV